MLEAGLSETQLSALTEMFHLGMNQAADSLSEMINEAVELISPAINVDFAVKDLGPVSWQNLASFSSITQTFNGSFDGSVLMLLQDNASLDIVRCVMPEGVSPEDLAELKTDALIEIGNVVLNASLSTISNILSCELTGGIPTYKSCNYDELFTESGFDECRGVIQVNLPFFIPAIGADGALCFWADNASFERALTLLDRMPKKVDSL